MKQFILLVTVAMGTLSLYAQPGVVKVAGGTHLRSSNGAHVVVSNMHLLNNGTIYSSTDNTKYILSGTASTTITGTGNSSFRQLELRKGGVLLLGQNISVSSSLQFTSGMLYLDQYVVDLGTTGVLIGESESSRTFTAASGYLQATADLNAPSNANPGNLGLIISSPESLGTTTIRRGHQVQQNVNGTVPSIARYYDITPTFNVALKASIRFHYFDAELNGLPEPNLFQWKSRDATSWDFVGADGRDVNQNYVLREHIGKLSRWTLSTEYAPRLNCPSITSCPANSTICMVPTNTYTIPPLVTDPNCGTASVSYSITGATVRSGTGNDASGLFYEGRSSIAWTVSDMSGNIATCQTSITVTSRGNCRPAIMVQSQPLELNEQLIVKAFPNPSQDYFTIETKTSSDQPVTLSVTDVLGRVVEVKRWMRPNGTIRLGNGYARGAYMVRVMQGEEKVTLKLVKQ